jgi:predicted transposase YbfD/YdcC
METAGRLRFADVLVSIEDPRQSAKVKHDRVELLVVAVNAVLVGADTFVEMELWAEEKLEWLRGYLRLPHGIPSHDTFGRIFGLIDPQQFESAFRRWVSGILPVLGAEIVAIDGKTSRRSGGIDTTAPHMVSAFAAWAGMVLGQRATAEKSNEITAIPELLSTLALTGCTVTLDAMGTQTAIAGAIQERGADYVLAVKDNQPKLAESIQDFWNSFRAHLLRAWKRIMAAWKSAAVPSSIDWSVSTIRSNGRGCVASQCSNRNGRSATKLPTNSACISAACPPDAERIRQAIRSHWAVENRLHWVMDVSFNDDRMRARTKAAAHNLAVLKHITLKLIRLDPVKRIGSIKTRRIITATSDQYRAEL